MPNQKPFGIAKWRRINGKRIYFRSRWEWNFALYLQYLKGKHLIEGWEYEYKTFWFLEIKRGTRSYLPDFKVSYVDGKHHWVEVKGYLDTRSKTKLKRFAKYYPEEPLVLIKKEWFKLHEPSLIHLRGWEPIFKAKKK